jgi:PqqD family protein of HPr-rel-A system
MNRSTDPQRGVAWRASGLDNLVWAAYDDDYIVYHRASGKTHFLNAATATLLTRVLETPKAAAEAAAELAAIEQAAVDDGFVAAVEASLHDLEHLGLVEQRDG